MQGDPVGPPNDWVTRATANLDGLCRRAAWRLSNRGTDAGRVPLVGAPECVQSYPVRQVACAIAGRFSVHFCERDVSILPVPGKDSIRTFGIFQVCVLYQPKGTK